MDDATAQFRAEADTGQAKSEFSSLSEFFKGFFGEIGAGADLARDAFRNFVSDASRTGEVGKSWGKLKDDLRGILDLVGGGAGGGGSGGVTGGLGLLDLALAGISGTAVATVAALTAVAGAATAAGYAAYSITKSFADTGDRFLTLSKQTGAAVESLSAWDYIGQQTSTSAEAIAGAVFKMGINLENGSKRTTQAVKGIGLSIDELKASKPEDAFATIMARLGEIPDQAQRAAAGVAIFGPKFRQIAQLAEEDLIGMTSAARQFGLVMSEEMAEQGDRFGDTIADLGSIMTGLKNIIGAALLPIFNNVLTVIRDGLIVAIQILKDSFGPLIAAWSSAGKGIEEFSRSSTLATGIMRAVVTAVTLVVDAFASLLKAAATVISAWYEIRIAANTLLIAFGGVVEGILKGTLLIISGMQKITFGPMAQKYAQDAALISAKLADVQGSVNGLTDKNAQLRASQESVTTTLRVTALALNAGADAARKTASSTTLAGLEAFKAAEKTKGLGQEVDLTADKVDALGKKEASLRTEIATLATELSNAQKNHLSLAQITELHGSKIKSVTAAAKEFGIELPQSIIDAYNAINDHDIGELLVKQLDKFYKEQDKLNAAVQKTVDKTSEATVKSLVDANTATATYTAKNVALTQNALQQRLAQIEKERQAELGKLTGVGAVYDRARAQVNQFYDQQKNTALGTYDTIEARMRAAGVATAAEQEEQTAGFLRDYQQMRASGLYTADQLRAAWTKYYDSAEKQNHGWLTDFQGVLSTVATSFQQLAQIGGEAFAGIARGVGTAIGGVNTGLTSLTTFNKAWSGLKSGATSLMGALPGMMAGISGLVSVAALAFEGLKKLFGKMPEWKKVIQDTKRDFGIEISEQLAKSIEADSKKIGDRVAATLKHLKELADAEGGITVDNVAKYTGKVHDLYSMLQRGLLTTLDVQKNVDALFPDLAKAATDAGGIVSRQVFEIMRLDAQMGTHSKAIADFIKQNVSLALEGLNELVTSTTDSIAKQFDDRMQFITRNDAGGDAFAGLRAAFRDVRDEDIPSLGDKWEDYTRKFNALTKEQQAAFTEESAKLRATYEGDFHNLEVFTRATFGAMQGSGDTYFSALKKLAPELQELDDLQKKLGFTSVDAKTQELIATQRLVDAHPQLIAQIEAVQKVAIGLGNAVGFDQEAFDSLSQTIGSQKQQMLDAGFSNEQALKAQAPAVQTLIELMDRFNFKVDDATQSLIDQEIEAGNVGDAHKSAQERTVDALDRVVGRFDLLLESMGVKVPQAAEEMASRTEASLGRVHGSTDTATSKFGDLKSSIAGAGEQSTQSTGSITGDMSRIQIETEKAVRRDEDWQRSIQNVASQSAAAGISISGDLTQVQGNTEATKDKYAFWKSTIDNVMHAHNASTASIAGDLTQTQQRAGTVGMQFDLWKRSIDNVRTTNDAMTSVVSGELVTLFGKTQAITSTLQSQASVWDGWANDAIGNIREVQGEVDALSFGHSPGGLKEWLPMVRNSARGFKDFSRDAVDALRTVQAHVNAMPQVVAGAITPGSVDGGARPTSTATAMAAAAAGSRVVEVHAPITFQGDLFDPQGLLTATDSIIGPHIAGKIHRNEDNFGTMYHGALNRKGQ